MEYVTKIASEEQKLIDSEEKIQRGIEPQWEKKTTEHERFMEMTEGLGMFSEKEEGDKDDDKDDDKKEEEIVTGGMIM